MITRQHVIGVLSFALCAGAAGVASGVLLPYVAHAATATFFGPIISPACNCATAIMANGVTVGGSAPAWGCVLQTIQNVMNFIVTMATLAITIFIALAGFSYMASGGNPEKRSVATKRIMNAVIGLLIVLCAYLLVDSIMKVIYNQGSQFGPWNSILVGNGTTDDCIRKQDSPGLAGLSTSAASATTGGTAPTTLLQTGTGACSAPTVQADATQGGYAISTAEANTLACLAKPESSCGANTSGAKTTSGKSTSASGPWQILVGAKDACHSLDIPACGNLNCSAAYSKGVVKSDAASQALAQQCQAEVNNLACSAAAAACIVQQSGGYSAWTADSRSSAQQSCIAQYASGS